MYKIESKRDGILRYFQTLHEALDCLHTLKRRKLIHKNAVVKSVH